MDLLYTRYASPCPLVNGMVQAGRFSEFVDNLIRTANKEREEKTNWEFYLHRVFDKNFNDFLEEMENNEKNMNMSKQTLEAIRKRSRDILDNFNPDMQGGE